MSRLICGRLFSKARRCTWQLAFGSKKVSEYDQEIPQSLTAVVITSRRSVIRIVTSLYGITQPLA